MIRMKNKTGFTFADGFSQQYPSTRRGAFTLAEVLITLGVIGVVAALTLPNLIQNYQKHVAVNRLKVNYNILSNAVRRAEADFGDITSWDLVNNARAEYEEDEDKASAKTQAGLIIKKYFMPYLVGAQFTETTSLADLGYKRGIFFKDGSRFAPPSVTGPILRLNNGTIILLQPNAGTDPETGKKVVVGMNMAIDIDGPTGYNLFGKDVFMAIIPYAHNTRLMFMQSFVLSANNTIRLDNDTRSAAWTRCASTGFYCGRLIQMDGWQIKDDYPW